MTNEQKLTIVKLTHTLVWVFYNGILGYLLYAAITNKVDKWTWICWGFIVIEVLILAVFKNICPITLIARKFSNSRSDNFDIFLPLWLARNNKIIYSIIICIIILISIISPGAHLEEFSPHSIRSAN